MERKIPENKPPELPLQPYPGTTDYYPDRSEKGGGNQSRLAD